MKVVVISQQPNIQSIIQHFWCKDWKEIKFYTIKSIILHHILY